MLKDVPREIHDEYDELFNFNHERQPDHLLNYLTDLLNRVQPSRMEIARIIGITEDVEVDVNSNSNNLDTNTLEESENLVVSNTAEVINNVIIRDAEEIANLVGNDTEEVVTSLTGDTEDIVNLIVSDTVAETYNEQEDSPC